MTTVLTAADGVNLFRGLALKILDLELAASSSDPNCSFAVLASRMSATRLQWSCDCDTSESILQRHVAVRATITPVPTQ